MGPPANPFDVSFPCVQSCAGKVSQGYIVLCIAGAEVDCLLRKQNQNVFHGKYGSYLSFQLLPVLSCFNSLFSDGCACIGCSR